MQDRHPRRRWPRAEPAHDPQIQRRKKPPVTKSDGDWTWTLPLCLPHLAATESPSPILISPIDLRNGAYWRLSFSPIYIVNIDILLMNVNTTMYQFVLAIWRPR